VTRSVLRRRAWMPALVTALAVGVLGLGAPTAGAAPAAPAAAPAARAADPVAHDPTMVKEGDWFYVVITGDFNRPNTFMPVKRSKDLVNWEELGPVFSTLPSWIVPTLGIDPSAAPKDLWAPDLSWDGDEWRLYYSVSQFGRNNSVIGMATTPTLDPASPAFGWTDQGLVLQSKPSPGNPQEYNAIDPDYTVDAQGNAWLSFGSFWTGLKMVAVDAATGKPASTTPQVVDLVDRKVPPNAVEGPSIIRHDGYYYLFAAFDFCCRGVESDYRVVVGRSTSITGPYVDREGRPMLAGGGTEVLRGYNEFQGTGHPDVYSTGGVDYFVNHYYDATDDGTPKLNVRTLAWDGGWPTVSDPLNPSRSTGHGSAYVTVHPRGGDTVVEDNGCGYEGANIGLWDDLGNTCQQWQLDDRGTGTRILNRFSNKVAEVAPCDGSGGSNVQQWGWVGFLPDGNDCQRWGFSATADGWTTISSILPQGRVWTADGDPSTTGTNVAVRDRTGAEAQQFRFQPVGEVLLASPTALTETLGVNGCKAGKGNGEQVRFQPRDAGGCQTWRLDPAGGAGYTVTSPASGRQLAPSSCVQGSSAPTLRLVPAGSGDPACRTWTLTPTDDGTWALAAAGSTQVVRLLIP